MTMFPTHVGMNRPARTCSRGWRNVPHTRGDEPAVGSALSIAEKCSPHTWG